VDFLNLNHIKLLEGAVIAVCVLGLTRPLAPHRLPRETWAGILFLSAALLSALLAETYREDALKFVGRLATGVFVLLVVLQLVQRRPDRINGLLWAITIGAGLSALLGLGEVAGLPGLEFVLPLFKLAPTRVGADLRLSGSFQYATIAAAFFELAAPLAVVLAATQVQRWRQALAAGVAMLCSVALVLTVTRAAIGALAAAFALLIILAFARPRWRRLALPSLLACVSGAIALGVLGVRMRNFDSRFGTENDWGWYAASYDVPATLTISAESAIGAVVTARNTGQVVWTARGPQGFALAYRWLSADATAQLDLPATSFDLPHDVAPGEAVQVDVDVGARLPPGDYRLAWGMLQQHVLWFHDRGYPDAETVVHVIGTATAGASAVDQEPRSDLAAALPPVARVELWSVALTIIRQHPLLGAGPDNFRHIYGAYLGLPTWDDRVHANNLYLELLADVGLLGAIAFGILVALPITRLLRALVARPTAPRSLWLAGFAASLLAYFLHGGLDSFLDFTPVYLLFWVVLGLGAATAELESC
jgi:O-antigen ligase